MVKIIEKKINGMHTIIIDPEGEVICDYCNADYTNNNEHGGFIFQSKAVCPQCAPRMMVNIIGFHEQKYIRAMCPPHLLFRDFVYEIRIQQNALAAV